MRAGLLSTGAAREVYGVELVGNAINLAATNALRASLRAVRLKRHNFDYGPYGELLEQLWPPEISAECARLANSLPVSARDCAKHVLYMSVRERAQSSAPRLADLRAERDALRQRLSRALV